MNLADAIAVQLMRELEHGEPTFNPDIDLKLTLGSASFGSDSGKQRLLARRAEAVLASRGARAPAAALNYLKAALVIVLLIVVFSAPTICFGSLLVPDGEHKVSVQGFFLFALIALIPTISTLLVIISVFCPAKGNSPLAHVVLFCATQVLIVSRFLIWLIEMIATRLPLPQLRDWLKVALERVFKLKAKPNLGVPAASKPRNSDATQCRIGVVREFEDTLSEGGTARSAMTAVLSVLKRWRFLPPFAVAALSTLSGLFFFAIAGMTTAWASTWNQFDYKWHSSLLSNDQKLKCVSAFGAPLPLLGISIPNEAAMAWVSGDPSSIAVEEPSWRAAMLKSNPDLADADNTHWQRLWLEEQRKQREAIDGFRRTWTKYLLGLLAVYGVVLRVLLIVPLWLAWRRVGRCITPDLAEPYFRETLSNLQNPPIGTEPGTSKPERHDATSPVAHDIATGGPRPASANTVDLLVVGYEAHLPPERTWRELLEVPSRSVSVEESIVETLANRRDVLQRISAAPPTKAMILAVNAAESPDQTFQSFLADLHRKAASLVTVVVLTGLERLRQKHRGNPKHVAAHLQAWRDACGRQRIANEHIIEFDVEHRTADTRESLRHFWEQALLVGAFTAPRRETCVAGRFRSAGQVILEETKRLQANRSVAGARSPAQVVQERLLALYNQDGTLFLREIKRKLASVETIAVSHWNEVQGQIAPLAAMWEICKSLKPRWAIAGATAGVVLAVSGTLAIAPVPLGVLTAIVSGATTGGLLGGLSSMWPELQRRFGGESEDSQSERLTCHLSLDDFVRQAVIFALVLEMQGTPAADIVVHLKAMLSDAPDSVITTSDQAAALVDYVAIALDRLPCTPAINSRDNAK